MKTVRLDGDPEDLRRILKERFGVTDKEIDKKIEEKNKEKEGD